MADLLVVVCVIFLNWKKAAVYFWLAVISGIMFFSSCLLGKYLSRQAAPLPMRTPYMSQSHTPYMSQMPSRSHSMHTIAYTHSQAPTVKLQSPIFRTGTWAGDLGRNRADRRTDRDGSNDTEESYPWIFVQGQHRQYVPR